MTFVPVRTKPYIIQYLKLLDLGDYIGVQRLCISNSNTGNALGGWMDIKVRLLGHQL